jgi:acyl carrier protein phosphodiesterase
MNHLAHLLLSGPDAALRAGGFLGDFVRGPLRGERPARIETGIALHRFVDATVDAHPAVHAQLATFPAPWRRWAPVALDVLFDHYLAEDFEAHAGEALAPFAAAAYADVDAHRAHLPPPARRTLDGMREIDLLVRYRERDAVARALGRIAERRPRAAPLATIDPLLRERDAALREAFAVVLPALAGAARRWREGADGAVDSRRPDHHEPEGGTRR